DELRKRQASAKKSKTYAGKTSGKPPKSKASSSASARKNSRSQTNRSGKNAAAKKKSGKYTLYYALIGIVVIIALTILSTTVLFNIGVFVVNGETIYSDEEIIEACGISKGENLLKINTGKAEERIVYNLVYIESAKVNRGFPNRLTLSVKPAKATVAFAYGGKYYVISEQKRLLEISDTPLGCPVVKGVQMILQPKEDKKEVTTDSTSNITTAAEPAVPTAKEGITLENDAEEIAAGVTLGDDDNGRIKLALSIAKLMTENGLTKDYELNIADTLGVQIRYDGHITLILGTTAALNDKIYKAGRVIEEDIRDNENCSLNLTNPDRAVKRPIYENNEVTTAPETEPVTGEVTTEPENGGEPEPEA
ncbi:MAG: FtsQ-type POTRA domain-containing protein, partial [Ruminiclostridium sp.]|nr:FtsQ-type POTRA domain-containing protein [Ruminiclostridium sp.]